MEKTSWGGWRPARFFFSLLFLALLVGSCGEDLKATNEKLQKDVAGLTAENERLKAENTKMRNDLSTLHGQVAELNIKVASLQDQNQSLQKEMDKLKTQVTDRRKKT
jgi:cell division protein FtsB